MMIYKIRFQLSPFDGASIIDDYLIVEAQSAEDAIKEAIKLLEEEYSDGILLEIFCEGETEA